MEWQSILRRCLLFTTVYILHTWFSSANDIPLFKCILEKVFLLFLTFFSICNAELCTKAHPIAQCGRVHTSPCALWNTEVHVQCLFSFCSPLIELWRSTEEYTTKTGRLQAPNTMPVLLLHDMVGSQLKLSHDERRYEASDLPLHIYALLICKQSMSNAPHDYQFCNFCGSSPVSFRFLPLNPVSQFRILNNWPQNVD